MSILNVAEERQSEQSSGSSRGLGAVAVTPAAREADGHTGGARRPDYGRAAPNPLDLDASPQRPRRGAQHGAPRPRAAGSPDASPRSGGAGAEPPLLLGEAEEPLVHTKKISGSKSRKTPENGGSPSARAARKATFAGKKAEQRRRESAYFYRPRRMSRSAWVADVQTELRELAEGILFGKTRRSLLRKATALGHCGTYTRLRRCIGCGHRRCGSGVQGCDTSVSGAKPCRTRICSVCCRSTAQESRQKLKARTDELREAGLPAAYGFKTITVQTQYDPYSEDDGKVEAIGSRIDGVWAMLRAIQKWTAQRWPGSGGHFHVEISGGGFVHAHGLVLSGFLPKEHLELLAQKAFKGAGKLFVEEISGGAEEVTRAILETAKYAGKGPSPLSEGWLEGAERDVLDPRLAARFELALVGRHVSSTWGSFRSSKKKGLGGEEATERAVEAEDANLACEGCGAVGLWQWEWDLTQAWVKFCHQRGRAAMKGSRWKPRPSPD